MHYTYIHIYISMYTHIYVYIYIFTYMYICTHRQRVRLASVDPVPRVASHSLSHARSLYVSHKLSLSHSVLFTLTCMHPLTHPPTHTGNKHKFLPWNRLLTLQVSFFHIPTHILFITPTFPPQRNDVRSRARAHTHTYTHTHTHTHHTQTGNEYEYPPWIRSLALRVRRDRKKSKILLLSTLAVEDRVSPLLTKPTDLLR